VNVSQWPSIIFPSHGWPFWYVGRAIYTECWGTISQYTVSLSLDFVTRWFSPHHHQLHISSSSSYPKKVSWTFLGCPYASFLTRSLCFLLFFSNSLLSVCGHLSREPPGLNGLKPDGPPWASLVLSIFDRLSQGSLSCLTVMRTIWSEWTRSGQSPTVCCNIPLEWLSRTVYECGLFVHYCTFLHSSSIHFSFLCLVKTFSSNACFS
jgi:hypothetical protein